MKKPCILIIEDDDFQYELYEEVLSDYELIRVCTAREALALLPSVLPHVILLDHILAEGDLGLDYLPEFKDLVPFAPIIVVSGALEVHQRIFALQGPRRAHYCLPKPVDLEELKKTVEVALRECGEAEVVRQFEALERSKRIDATELFSRSSDRLSRQTRLRNFVVAAQGRTNISALAREFHVARRTIVRDLHELIRRGELDEARYPKGDPEE
jgi:DNA-binding NtrC family response regulator